jgi:hypothetical protein
MNLVSGFVGIKLEEKEFLTPHIGWVVCYTASKFSQRLVCGADHSDQMAEEENEDMNISQLTA